MLHYVAVIIWLCTTIAKPSAKQTCKWTVHNNGQYTTINHMALSSSLLSKDVQIYLSFDIACCVAGP